jgi:hypothetical protein
VVPVPPPLAALGLDAPVAPLPPVPTLEPVGALLLPPPPPPQFAAAIAASAVAPPNRQTRRSKRSDTMTVSPLLAVVPRNMDRLEKIRATWIED